MNTRNGKDDWVEQAVIDAHTCLVADTVPDADIDCDYCRYRDAVEKVLSIRD